MVERSECMNVPNIRFKGFNGEWEKKKLGEVAPLKGGYAFNSANFKDSGIPIVRISNILESEEVGGEFVFYDKIKNEKQFLLRYEDIVIAMSGATTGKIALVKTKNKLYQNQRVGKFSRTSDVDYKYLSALVSSSNFSFELNKLLSSGAQPNVSSSDIDSIKLYFPSCKQEQFLLGSFLERINNIIVTTNLKLASLKRIKAASLQSMFPQEGETLPKVRFKGFEGEWDFVTAGEVFRTTNVRNRPDLPVLSATQYKGMVKRSDIGYQVFHDKSNETTYKHILPGQFIIHLRSFQGGFAHSNIEGIVSPAYTVMEFKNKEFHYDYFWKYIFTSKEFIKRLELITYGIRDGRTISFDEFKEMDFFIPSKLEQQKIASYFCNLDKQISLQTQRLEKLKQIKAACLDKMFV